MMIRLVPNFTVVNSGKKIKYKFVNVCLLTFRSVGAGVACLDGLVVPRALVAAGTEEL